MYDPHYIVSHYYIMYFFNVVPYYRLSERNCVEIVQKLVHLKLVDVIYTTDGKEYLTPQELSKEIREELQVRGGTHAVFF